MKYFRPINNAGESFGVWSFDGIIALRIGVPNPMNSPNSHAVVQNGEELMDAMARQLAAFFINGAPCHLADMPLKPGEYYHRIARPNDQNPNDYPIYPEPALFEEEIALTKGQLVSLISRLQQICQTIHPTFETYKTYGHEIRNLLILACTEVEAQFKGVLEANGASAKNTNDYAKLKQPMRLNEYSVSLTHYPWLPAFQPFKNWDQNNPTRSLDWYQAYHHVKHDRESKFSEATLIHAMQAVCACMIMLYAQFGRQLATRWRQEIAHFFELAHAPKFEVTEVYTHPYDGHAIGYTAVNYPF